MKALLVILSHPRSISVFKIFNDVMDFNCLNFGEKIRTGGEEIMNSIIEKKYTKINYKAYEIYSKQLFYGTHSVYN